MGTDESTDIRHPEIDIKEAIDVYYRLLRELGSAGAHLTSLQAHLLQGEDSLPTFVHQARRSIGASQSLLAELSCLTTAAMTKLDKSCDDDGCWCSSR